MKRILAVAMNLFLVAGSACTSEDDDLGKQAALRSPAECDDEDGPAEPDGGVCDDAERGEGETLPDEETDESDGGTDPVDTGEGDGGETDEGDGGEGD